MSKHLASHLYDRVEAATKLADYSSIVRELRVILEQLFKQLTQSDNRSFSNLFGRIEFVFDKMQVTALMQEQINSLRIFGNKVAHGHSASEKETLLSIKALAEAIFYFYEEPIPKTLSDYYIKVRNEKFVRPAYRNVELVEMIKPVVLEVHHLSENERGVRYFTLRCKDDDLGEFQLRLWDTEKNQLTKLHALLKPYDTIHVLNVKRVPEMENHYSSVALTQVILEPDILIDISDLAECFQMKGEFALLALLKKLVPQDYSEAAFQGNMVNALLDVVIRDEQPDFKTAFRDAVADNVLQAAAYGRETLLRIYNTIKEKHWRNVLNVAGQYSHLNKHIEPTFFSAIYGLQGRLDLLVEDTSDPMRKEIVELKSGKAPGFNTWRNNEMQVVGYNLLLRSAYGNNRTGASGILYSSADRDPLRDVVSNNISENKLIMLRNEVVFYFLQLAIGNMDVLNRIKSSSMQDLPGFSLKDVELFEHTYSTAGLISKSYYHHFLSFIFREWLHEKCGMYAHPDREENGDGFASLWLQSEEEKKQRFSIITGLRFADFEPESSVLKFKMEHPTLQHNFRPGDTVLLYHRIEGRLAPLSQQIVKGRLDSITGGNVLFSLNNRQIDNTYFNSLENEWIIEHDIFESNNWVATRSLFEVLSQANDQRFRLLMGLEPPVTLSAELPHSIAQNADLNENQRTIIKKALEARDYFLIQGPPGTGKTSTLLPHLVRGLFHQPETGSIAIVAFTNRAVDEIAIRLEQQGIEFIRMGNRKSAAEQKLRQYCTDGDIVAAREYIQSHKVFLSTVTTMAGRIEQLRLLKDDLNTVIVDEASQLTEPQLLSLVLNMKKFILIGDQNQLPPVVAIHEEFCQTEDAMMNELGLGDLRTALFERLFLKARQNNWHYASDMLTTHFRMHEEIAGLINHWYAGKLQSGKEEQKESLGMDWVTNTSTDDYDWTPILKTGRAIYLPSRKEANSKSHQQEAERVVSLLRYLRRSYGPKFDPDKVGVVTPWRTQIGLIRNLIGDDPELQQLNIDTVERFQGSENDIIIVSLAVYHPIQVRLLTSAGKYSYESKDGQLSEIEVDRKLLVTLSRAKKQVILMGYEPALRTSTHYTRILNEMTCADTLQ